MCKVFSVSILSYHVEWLKVWVLKVTPFNIRMSKNGQNLVHPTRKGFLGKDFSNPSRKVSTIRPLRTVSLPPLPVAGRSSTSLNIWSSVRVTTRVSDYVSYIALSINNFSLEQD